MIHAHVVVLAAVSLCPGQEARLELRPLPGHSVRYRVHQCVETDFQAGARTTTTIDLDQELELVTREVLPTGLLSIDLVLRRVRGKVSSGIQVTEFDSFAPQVTYPGAFDLKVRELVMLGGQTLHLHVRRDGRVENLEGYEEIYADTEIGDLMKKAGGDISNASFLEEAQFFFPGLATVPVAEGAKWDFAYPFTLFGQDSVVEPRCTLGELTEETAQWTFLASPIAGEEGEGAAATPAGASTPAKPLLAATKILSASLQGNTTIARADGLVLTQDLERIVGVELPHPRGGTAKMVVTQTLEMRRVTGDEPSEGRPPDPGRR